MYASEGMMLQKEPFHHHPTGVASGPGTLGVGMQPNPCASLGGLDAPVLPGVGFIPAPNAANTQSLAGTCDVDMIEQILRNWRLFDDEEEHGNSSSGAALACLEKQQTLPTSSSAGSAAMEDGPGGIGGVATQSQQLMSGGNSFLSPLIPPQLQPNSQQGSPTAEQWAEELIMRLQGVNGDLQMARSLLVEALQRHATAQAQVPLGVERADRLSKANKVLLRALRASAARTQELKKEKEDQDALRQELAACREQLRQSEQSKAMLQWQLQQMQAVRSSADGTPTCL